MRSTNKLTIFGLFLLGVVAVCWAEECTTNGDCTTTTCTNGAVICQHPDGAGITNNGGLCTCGASTGQCQTQADCFSSAGVTLNCADSSRHCYDNRCICDRFPGGKKK